jgi:hypothetical protein
VPFVSAVCMPPAVVPVSRASSPAQPRAPPWL